MFEFQPLSVYKSSGEGWDQKVFSTKNNFSYNFLFYELDDAQVSHFDNDDDDDDEQVSHLDAGGGVHNLEPDGKP